MDDMEDDARYPPKSFPLSCQNPSSHRHKHPNRAAPFHHRPPTTRYKVDEEDDEEFEDAKEFDDYNDDDDAPENGYAGNFEEDDGFARKKRKLRGGPSNYEFAPRAKFPFGNRGGSSSAAEEWTEHATLVLLEVWGDKFLQIGRNSLRSEEWHEVAEKVSDELKVERTVAQCMSVLDKLKRRYKKEKARIDEMGVGVSSCKWPFFKKMDMLMASSARQEYGLACGVDSGEYVFMNTRVYLNRSNGFDEMRDSPGESETSEENDSDGVAAGPGGDGDEEDDETSYRVLADSIQKFGKIYEKIENTKRQQMMELEKMRLDFNRELELQKKQILERAEAEIAKMQEVDEDETDSSTENLSE
ncbi:trihelix transcription factor ASIL2 [Lotus japonicus]|uniref:trihelix transcription factor ASIL2 n=1 Tax=Lotus japonicus TaxID=34305 RepID=UPI00258D0642|nr:trihelix transcription factor ASIL2 [Lotus japonicus]